MNMFARIAAWNYDQRAIKENLWLPLIICLAYCIDAELYKAIDYLRERIRILIEQQEKHNKRIRLTDNQRMRVAAKVKRLSRKMLERCTELFAPDTVMRWYLELISEKHDGSQNRPYGGRPPITQEIVHMGKIGLTQHARMMDLWEEHFMSRSFGSPPDLEASLQCPERSILVFARVVTLNGLKQDLGFQARIDL